MLNIPVKLVVGARCCPVEEKLAFAGILRESCRTLELCLCFGKAAQLEKEVSANAGQQVVSLERRLRSERVNELEARGGTKRHRDGNGSIQLHNGRRRELCQSAIERGDAVPIRFRCRGGASVTRSDGGLQTIRPKLST